MHVGRRIYRHRIYVCKRDEGVPFVYMDIITYNDLTTILTNVKKKQQTLDNTADMYMLYKVKTEIIIIYEIRYTMYSFTVLFLKKMQSVGIILLTIGSHFQYDTRISRLLYRSTKI